MVLLNCTCKCQYYHYNQYVTIFFHIMWNRIPFCLSNSDQPIFFVLQNPHTPVFYISVFSPFCVCLVWPRGNCFTCDDSSSPRSSLSSSWNLILNHYRLDYHASTCRCFVTFLWIVLAQMNLSLGLGCEAPNTAYRTNFSSICGIAKLVGLFYNHFYHWCEDLGNFIK